MARNDPQVNIRLPADLKTQLDEAAARSGRSMTAELVYRLERSLDRRRGNASLVLAKIIEILPKWEKAVLELGEEIELFGQGEPGALEWLRLTAPSLDQAALLKAANTIESNMKRDIQYLRSQVPEIIRAAEEGGDAPQSVSSLLMID